MSISASEMVSLETETVENTQLIYAKWSLLSIKFIIINITFKVFVYVWRKGFMLGRNSKCLKNYFFQA